MGYPKYTLTSDSEPEFHPLPTGGSLHSPGQLPLQPSSCLPLPSSPARPVWGWDGVSSGGPLGGTQVSILRGSSLDQHPPVSAPGCTPLLHCSPGPHTPEACSSPTPSRQSQENFLPGTGKPDFMGSFPRASGSLWLVENGVLSTWWIQ